MNFCRLVRRSREHVGKKRPSVWPDFAASSHKVLFAQHVYQWWPLCQDNNDTGSRLRAQRYARVPIDKRERREEHFFIPLNTIKELQACF